MSRSTLAATLVVATAAAFGCSTKMTVVDPPSTNPPNPTTAPVFNGEIHQAASAPIPISGGTLLTMTKQDGSALAFVADPEEDVIDVVALGATPKLLGTLPLQPGDEPGRMVADSGGRVHVVLRSGGGIATIMPNSTGASLVARRGVCSAPRGIDYDVATDSVIVACATGEVVSLPAAGGAATASADIDRDLRDVVVSGDKIFVTRFRSAQLLTLDRTFKIIDRSIPSIGPSNTSSAAPDVAWRAVKQPSGAITMLHQVASNTPINVALPPGVSSYGGGSTNTGPQQVNGGAGGVVVAAVSSFGGASTMTTLTSNPVVDIAVQPNGTFETVSITGTIETSSSLGALLELGGQAPVGQPDAFVAIADASTAAVPQVVVQRRGSQPALLIMPINGTSGIDVSVRSVVALPQKSSHVDTGFDVFHMPASPTASIACMNCHPEGGDDSHTWQFQMANDTRARRTQSLRGGIIQESAPYHWDGDMSNLQVLCDEVFTHRMGGGALTDKQTPILARFINALPRVPVKATLDQDRVMKGKAIFDGPAACGGCHVGGTGTLQANQDIGKVDMINQSSAPLQVPMLIGVADRAPYMHDGCAATLMDRLTVDSCTGSKHGDTKVLAGLSGDDKTNLVEYLQSL